MKKLLTILLGGLLLVSCGPSKSASAQGSEEGLEQTLDDKNRAVIPLITRIQKLPGVAIRAGRPVFVKNNNSARGSMPPEPLYVVDGLIIGNSFNSVKDIVQPVDVKSIEALNGSEASFYGARGANGVILITTRKGG